MSIVNSRPSTKLVSLGHGGLLLLHVDVRPNVVEGPDLPAVHWEEFAEALAQVLVELGGCSHEQVVNMYGDVSSWDATLLFQEHEHAGVQGRRLQEVVLVPEEEDLVRDDLNQALVPHLG